MSDRSLATEVIQEENIRDVKGKPNNCLDLKLQDEFRDRNNKQGVAEHKGNHTKAVSKSRKGVKELLIMKNILLFKVIIGKQIGKEADKYSKADIVECLDFWNSVEHDSQH